MTQAAVKTRFAPSPTGLVHIGNARTALFSALLGDQFLLRIEDTDAERSRPEFVEALIEDLRWLGLQWDEGPENATVAEAWYQSARSAIYNQYYDQLVDNELAYPCFCSPQELEIHRKVQLSSGRPPRYSGKCAKFSVEERQQRIDRGDLPTLRFRVNTGQTVHFEDGVRGPQKFQTDDIGDFIIRRADGSAAFFFCNAIDDALMGVTRVVRGEDHLSNTPRQLLILKALNLPQPDYAHTSLILGDDGAPLSKRNGSRSIRELREAGYFALAVVNSMARLGHHYESDDLMDYPALKAGFRLQALGRSPARFDVAHLNHWQSLVLRRVSDTILDQWLMPETLQRVPKDHRTLFRELVRSNCAFPQDAETWSRILFTDESLSQPEEVLAEESYYRAALAAHETHPSDYAGFLQGLKETSGAKGRGLFMPLRMALTGRHDGPELAHLYQLISSERLVHRLTSPIALKD
jgi:nondiscriminating glutamyl-tRNA synthetase